MEKAWKRFLRAVGWLGDVQAILAVVPVGLVAIVSGWSVYLQQGFGWAVFIASGVFCFVTLSYVLVRESYRANRLPHKINVSGFELIQMPPADGDTQVFFRPLLALQSTANFEIAFELVRVDYSFGSIVGSLDRTTTLKGTLAPHGTGNLTIPSAKGFPPAPKGRVVVELNYGRAGGDISHTLSTTLESTPTNIYSPLDKPFELIMVRNVERLEYRKLKA